MEEKRYLKWYNKVGYGSGDVAGNVVYAFLSTFVMLYLTNTVGLNPGIVGTLIAVSKLFDGVTDIFFGSMIDKTKTKMGKAKPWMLYGYIGCAVTLIGVFAIPESLGQTAQYAWFFIAYTLLNAVFYTANNIAYAAELQTRTTPLSVLYVEYVRKSALLLKSYIQNNTNSIQTVTITIYVYDQDDNYKKTSYERTMQFPASGILTVTCNIPDVETGEYLVLSASNDEGIIMDGHTRIKII